MKYIGLILLIFLLGCGGTSKEQKDLAKRNLDQDYDKCLNISTTYTEYANCANSATVIYFRTLNYQYMDAIYASNINHLEYARMVDTGQMSPEEAFQRWRLSRRQWLTKSIQYRELQEAQNTRNYHYNYTGSSDEYGTPIYSPNECIGPIIMGECHGTILPKAGYRKRCYGTMLNGKCTGPAF